MRRRTLMASGLLIGMVGCTRTRNPAPQVSSRSSEVMGAEAGDFALLFSNLGAGEDPAQRQGRVCLLGSDGVPKGTVEFTPMDNARLTTHNGAVAWLANDAAHYWADTHRTWTSMPSHGGAVDTLLPAEDHVLAIINEGTQDPESYQSGLFLFNASEGRAWKHPGYLGSGTGWSQGVCFGFSSSKLFDTEVQLTILDENAGAERFGPSVNGSSVWGERLVNIGEHSYALIAQGTSGPVAELWQVDVKNRSVSPVPLAGAAAEVSGWYSAGGPNSLTAIGDEVFWLDNAGLWAADPSSGDTRLVKDLADDAAVSWFLSSTGLIGVSGSRGVWDIALYSTADGKPQRRIEGIRIDGPSDLYPFGAVCVG